MKKHEEHEEDAIEVDGTAVRTLYNQDLSSDYSQAVAGRIDLPLNEIQRACEAQDIMELSRLVGPMLIATAAQSAVWHLRSDDLEERKLGTQQIKAILPYVMPKLEQVEINSNGSVAPDIVSYLQFLKS